MWHVLPISALFSDRYLNIFDYYKKHAKTEGQKKVQADLEKGYFYDHNEITKNPKGKLFGATGSKPLTSNQSIKFPLLLLDHRCTSFTGEKTHFEDTVLLNREEERAAGEGKDERVVNETDATAVQSPVPAARMVIVTLMRQFSAPMVDEWKAHMRKSHPDIPVKELILVESRGYQLTWGLWKYGLKKVIPEADWPDVYYYFSRPQKFCEKLKVTNKFVAYVYILDEHANVRWMGCGMPEGRELADLDAAVKIMQHK